MSKKAKKVPVTKVVIGIRFVRKYHASSWGKHGPLVDSKKEAREYGLEMMAKDKWNSFVIYEVWEKCDKYGVRIEGKVTPRY